MQIEDISQIDPELKSQLIDFIFSVKQLTGAKGCELQIINNVLNVVFTAGEVKGKPTRIITTKQRVHINCILKIYGDVHLDTVTIFHLKTELELIRQLVKNRLQLYFKEKWEELGFFFQSEEFFEQLKGVRESFMEITLNLKNYINKFVDIEFVGLVYNFDDSNFYLAERDADLQLLQHFSKPVLNLFLKGGAKWLEKKYADHWIIARKFSDYVLCLIFKGEPHPIYRTAISFLLSEILMLFTSIRWAQYHQEVSHEFMKGFISALEAKDIYTKGHSEGVSFYTEVIGKSLGLEERELKELRLAAILHDIGKVGIPDNILFKPGRLNSREYGIIKLHSVIGAELLRKIDRFSHLSPIVRAHHERWDGKGYPDGLRGEEIPLYARIIAVADAYDAMLGDRVYRKAKSKEETIKELERCAGSQFDPSIIEKCLESLKKCEIYTPRYHSFVPKTIEEVRKSYYFTDTLTGVRNSYALFEDLKLWNTPFFFVFFDIKTFKFFNIKEGLVKGNEILAKFASLLSNTFNTPYIYRIGGDDFLIVTGEQPYFKELTDIKQKIEEALGFGIRYEVRKVKDKEDVEKVIKELKLLSYCDFILEERFAVMSEIHEKVVVWNKRWRVVRCKGLSRDDVREITRTRKEVKPVYYQKELIGYIYIA